MSVLNKYLINKMGWLNYSSIRGIGIPNSFEADGSVKFSINNKKSKICYLIREIIEKEKENSTNSYNFIIMDYNSDSFHGSPNSEIVEFSNNQELMKLIMKYDACNEEYQRHFKLNKILKTK
jgi:hypothetical protein